MTYWPTSNFTATATGGGDSRNTRVKVSGKEVNKDRLIVKLVSPLFQLPPDKAHQRGRLNFNSGN